MLRPAELRAYVRSREEGYPDDAAKLRGLIATNMLRLYEQAGAVLDRKVAARTEVETLALEEELRVFEQALAENWKEFKHLFEKEEAPAKNNRFDAQIRLAEDVERLETTLNEAFHCLREIRRSVKDLS